MSDQPKNEKETEPGAVPPAAPYEPAPRRLTRRPEGKIIAGVCSGLGAYTGVDPVIWRIGLVVLVLAGGAGILAYIVAWLVMPMARPGEPLPEPALATDSSQVGRWVGIGLLAIGALLLFRGVWDFRGGIFWGLLLLGIGIAIWGRDLVGSPRPPSPRPSTPPPNSPPPTPETGTSPTMPMATPPTTPPPPTPPPRHSAASSVPRPSPAVG
ncbi:MAG: PspC domain-containing protein, partial [Actinomycetota bacterium]